MMPIELYMNQNVPSSITDGLMQRNVNIITAYQDGRSLASDSDLIDRATSLNRVIFSHDIDMVIEGNERMKNGINFSGVIYAHQMKISIGQAITELDLICQVLTPQELVNTVIFLPLS